MRRNNALQITTTKPSSSTFLTENKYISRSLINDLTECMKYLRMQQLSDYMRVLGHGEMVSWDDKGFPTTMADLEVLYGSYCYGYKVGPIWFYAGPEKTLPNEPQGFAVIKSNALNWCIDTILGRVDLKGYGVLKRLEIPL